MPLADLSFYNVVLAVHIGAVVVGFGMTFATPILFAVGARADPRSLPTLHRIERRISIISQFGLLVIVLAGLYLAHHLDAFKYFYVQWGIGVALLLGALAGAYMAPREKRLITIAERDIAAAPAGSGTVTLSDEYQSTVREVSIAGAFMGSLVLVTVLFMATHLGGPS